MKTASRLETERAAKRWRLRELERELRMNEAQLAKKARRSERLQREAEAVRAELGLGRRVG